MSWFGKRPNLKSIQIDEIRRGLRDISDGVQIIFSEIQKGKNTDGRLSDDLRIYENARQFLREIEVAVNKISRLT